MEKNRYSETALRTACYRAYHALHDVLEIFNDFLAGCLPANKYILPAF